MSTVLPTEHFCRVWFQTKQPPRGAGKPFPAMVEDRLVPSPLGWDTVGNLNPFSRVVATPPFPARMINFLKCTPFKPSENNLWIFKI